MILIVDSGSTKTDWIAIENTGKVLFETQTLGLNPQVLSSNILKERIVNNFELYKFRKEIDKIYFYGAGCGTKPPRILIKSVFINSSCLTDGKFKIFIISYIIFFTSGALTTAPVILCLESFGFFG